MELSIPSRHLPVPQVSLAALPRRQRIAGLIWQRAVLYAVLHAVRQSACMALQGSSCLTVWACNKAYATGSLWAKIQAVAFRP